MEVMFVLIGFSLLIAVSFLGAFIWAVKSGQFEDKYTPSVRILLDDNENDSSSSLNQEKSIEE